MANQALAALESALRVRKLDQTLTSALPPLDRTDAGACAATGIAPLDRVLRGGFPRGQLCEVAGPRSSGRMTLLLHLMAAATRQGEIVALVDTCDRLDLASVVAAGADLDRMLWIRGPALGAAPVPPSERRMIHPATAARSTAPLVDRAVERALKALNLVLQAGGFAVVAIDLGDVPPLTLKRLPFTTWMRVQRTVEGSDTACVLVVPEPLARSAGGLTVSLGGRTAWTGTTARSRRLNGMEIAARVISPRRRVEGEAAFMAVMEGG